MPERDRNGGLDRQRLLWDGHDDRGRLRPAPHHRGDRQHRNDSVQVSGRVGGGGGVGGGGRAANHSQLE